MEDFDICYGRWVNFPAILWPSGKFKIGVIIFSYFHQFSAKQSAFFLQTNVMILFFQK
jgi:hypothetical protein